MIISKRHSNWLFCVSFFFICAFTFSSTQVWAHSRDSHDASKSESNAKPGSIQQFAVETLSIPNVPVIDSDYRTEGFISRFANTDTVIISLTYTDCETLCPISNVILQQLDRAINKNNLPSIQIVTLSIDPEKDTPDAMRASANSLDSSDRWTWLTSTPQHSRMLLNSLDVNVSALEEHDPMFLVGNIATGRFIRVVGMPDPQQLIAISRSELL